MRTSKLKIDLDSTCKELKFLHVSILQTSTELANIWLWAFISETGEISLLSLLLDAHSARGEQEGFWLGAAATPELQQVTLISRVELTDLLKSCHLTPK